MRTSAELRQGLLTNILTVLNRPNEWENLLHDIVTLIMDFTGYEAIGIRLREGEDFPYFETAGFPLQFSEKRNSLCRRSPEGDIARRANGLPVLECMCGQVISGNTTPTLPQFTGEGSFWTNRVSELINQPGNSIKELFPRGSCVKDGYESIALIPLRSGEDVVGLLQFNDHRPDQFTPELIRFFEELGNTIGLAFNRILQEKRIREEEEQFRQLFENAPFPRYVYDVESLAFLNVNKAALEHYGFSREEFLTMTLKDIRPSEEISALIENLKLGQSEVQRSNGWKHQKKDGTIIDVQITSHATVFNGNKARVVLAQDVTEKLRQEKELRETKIYLEKLLENANAPIITLNADLSIRAINEAFEKMAGYTIEELSVAGFDILITDASQSIIRELIDQIGMGKQWNSLEIPIRTKSGLIRHVSWNMANIYQDDGTTLISVLAIGIDITERVAADQILRWENDVKEALAQLYTPLTDSTATISDFAGYVLQFAVEITGSRHGFVAEIDPGTRNLIIHSHTHPLEDREKYTDSEGRFIFTPNSDGTYRGLYGYALNTCEAFYTNNPATHSASVGVPPEHMVIEQFLCVPALINGEPVGEIALANPGHDFQDRDLEAINRMGEFYALAIQRKRTFDEIVQARQKAEESDRLKSSLLNNLSHEFRTPMNAILGFSSLIEQEASERSEIRGMGRRINDAGGRLMKTLDDILELSQVQAGIRQEIVPHLDIYQELVNMLPGYLKLAQRKQLQVHFRSNGRPTVLMVFGHFNQVMKHLIENAIKFTSQGKITIGISEYQSPVSRMAEISITDTGIGIAREHFEVIFDEFRQASEGYGRSYEGTGLGLTIVKGILELYGGSIQVESERGKGSTFTLLIPSASTENGNGKELLFSGEILAENIGKAKKEGDFLVINGLVPQLLTVEDNEDNIDVIRLLLRNKAHIDAARDAAMAIGMAREKQYDAILMDVHLGPGKSGLDATQEIRAISGYEHIPIIAVTGYTTPEYKEKIFRAGCSHYLGKPFSREQLLQKIIEAVSGPTYLAS